MKKLIWTIVICAVLLVGIAFFSKEYMSGRNEYVPPTASEIIEGENSSSGGFSQNYFWATIG